MKKAKSNFGNIFFGFLLTFTPVALAAIAAPVVYEATKGAVKGAVKGLKRALK